MLKMKTEFGSTFHNQDTRTHILEAAQHLFTQQGFHGTSMRQIAQDAGIALGGIYNHFPSKEIIFETIFEENHPYHDVLPILEQAQGDTPEALVRNAALHVLHALQARPDFLKLLFIELLEFKGIHLAELMANVFLRGVKLIEGFLEENSTLRPLPAPILLRSFLGLFVSYYFGELMLDPTGSSQLNETTFEHFIEIYLHGILTGEQV
jgi:AcrR family transcriptional regulator